MQVLRTVLTSERTDRNLIVCLPAIEKFTFSVMKKGISVHVRFPNAPFVTSYLNDTLICEKFAGPRDFDSIINIDPACDYPVTNRDMLNLVKERLAVKGAERITLNSKLCFDWTKPAVDAYGKRAAIFMSNSCCGDCISSDRFDALTDNVRDYVELPLYVNPWEFTTSDICEGTINSVKMFASLVSICFFYAGPHCIHSQIAALMGIPTFILQENPYDNIISVRDTVRAFESASEATSERYGSNFISKAYKFWIKSDRSISRSGA